jgi:phosphocarrier protein
LSKQIKKIQIINKRGLHARASAKFVKLAETFSSKIEVSKDGMTVCGTSIMGLMLLAAVPGDFIHLSITVDDEQDAMKSIEALINRKFEEEI